MARKPKKPKPGITDDVPFTAKLPDGRTLFVLIPAKWCETDESGEVLFKPEAARLIDRVQAAAMRVPTMPTPGRIRALREAMGMTQSEFGAAIGRDKMTIARWEWGKVTPGADAVKAIEKLRKDAGRKGVVIAA